MDFNKPQNIQSQNLETNPKIATERASLATLTPQKHKQNRNLETNPKFVNEWAPLAPKKHKKTEINPNEAKLRNKPKTRNRVGSVRFAKTNKPKQNQTNNNI